MSQTHFAPTRRERRRPPAAAPGRTPDIGRKLVGLLSALLVMSALLWLGHQGVLHGWWLLAITSLLLLAVPTFQELSWRIIVAGAMLFGALPLLWWIPNPQGLFNWGFVLLAMLASGLTLRVLGSANRRAALRSMLPSVTKADYHLVIAALIATVALAPFIFVFTGQQALSVLLTSWDNSSHFNMYNMLRSHGAVIPMAGVPEEGRVWSFTEYPQGFHAIMATMAELVVGPEPGSMSQELVSYSRLSALVAVAAAVLVTAGLISIPWIRQRALVSAPFLVLVATAWSFGTASHATFFAFQNFLLGVALVATLMVISAFADSLAKPIIFAAAASTVIGVAQTWALLLILAFPTVLLAILPWSGRRWHTTRRSWTINFVVAAFAMAGLLLVAKQLSGIGTDNVVAALGKIESSTHGVELATLLVAVTSSLLLGHGSFKQFFTGGGTRHVSARLIIVPLVGLVIVIAMGAYQVAAFGKVTYYSLKLALAVELLLPVVACVTVTALIDRWLSAHPYVHPKHLVIFSVLTALASTQIFGLTVPDTRPLGMEPVAPYQRSMSVIATQTATNGVAAEELFQAAQSYSSDRGDVVFITSHDQVDPLLAATWFLSLTGTHKDNTNSVLGELRPLYSGYSGNLKLAVENVLEKDRDVFIVLDKKLHSFLQSSGLPRNLLDRVISYN